MAWKVVYFLTTVFGIPGVLIGILADFGVFAINNWKANLIFILGCVFTGLRIYWYNRDKVRNDKKEKLQMKIMEQQLDINSDEIKPHQ